MPKKGFKPARRLSDFLFAYLQTTESLVAQCKVGDEGILRWWCNEGQATWVNSVHENSRSKSIKWLDELSGNAVTSSSSSNTRLLETLASMPSDQAHNRTPANEYILETMSEQARTRKQACKKAHRDRVVRKRRRHHPETHGSGGFV